jgi:hypothetical protein
MKAHPNPSMSASTMWTLGVEEGVADRFLKVEIKYIYLALRILCIHYMLQTFHMLSELLMKMGHCT